MKKPLKAFIREYSVRNKNEACTAVYSVTNSHGFMPSTEYFSKEVFSKDLSTYKVVKKGMVAYNPSRINVGSVAVQRAAEQVIVSPLYVVFEADDKELLPEYISYFLHSDIGLAEIAAHTSGSVRDSLKFTALQKIEINIVSVDEQKKIVDRLQRLEKIIDKKRKVLDKYENLVKSQFIEMFGTVGTNEKGWGLIALGDCCELNPKKSADGRLQDGLEVSFVPMPAVTEKGELDSSDIKLYEQVQKGFTYFADNDVLFAKITPCMENGKGAVARGLKNGVGFGSTEFHVLRPKAGVSNPVWLYTIMSFKQFRQDAARKMTGSAGQRRVPSSFLLGYKVSLPPITLQNQFAAFVEQTDKSKIPFEMEVAA
ncbi:MAG: restriction endonuclease subunit S [Firmicutes bacterium]|nr:restriction endonuclease subunit S [Bacillota bacterium]